MVIDGACVVVGGYGAVCSTAATPPDERESVCSKFVVAVSVLAMAGWSAIGLVDVEEKVTSCGMRIVPVDTSSVGNGDASGTVRVTVTSFSLYVFYLFPLPGLHVLTMTHLWAQCGRVWVWSTRSQRVTNGRLMWTDWRQISRGHRRLNRSWSTPRWQIHRRMRHVVVEHSNSNVHVSFGRALEIGSGGPERNRERCITLNGRRRCSLWCRQVRSRRKTMIRNETLQTYSSILELFAESEWTFHAQSQKIESGDLYLTLPSTTSCKGAPVLPWGSKPTDTGVCCSVIIWLRWLYRSVSRIAIPFLRSKRW